MNNIIGQLTDAQFKAEHPNAQISRCGNRALTNYGSATTNYWLKEKDGSWTNYDCKTDYFKNIRIHH